jgi:hypothetical protein
MKAKITNMKSFIVEAAKVSSQHLMKKAIFQKDGENPLSRKVTFLYDEPTFFLRFAQ